MEVYATPPSPIGSVSVEISLDVTPCGDRIVVLDVEPVDLIAVKETKLNPRKWVKRRESQVGEIDQLKLKMVVFHNDRDGEVHMTHLVGFVIIKSVSIV